MTERLTDILESLLLVMAEETHQLGAAPFGPALPELAATKVRLVGQLDRMIAAHARATTGWERLLDDEQRLRFADLLVRLDATSAANAAALERQIDLCVEMIGAITGEAKRIAGRATATYGAEGRLERFDPTMPIAVNSRY